MLSPSDAHSLYDPESWFRSKRGHEPFSPSSWLSLIPFVATFLAVAFFSWCTLFPLLSGQSSSTRSASRDPRNASFRLSKALRKAPAWLALIYGNVSVFTFSCTVALSAVLAELIVCEISGLLDPAARGRALEITVSALLVSLVVVIPMLQIHSITSAASWRGSGLKQGTRMAAWVADLFGLALWLAAFWQVGRAVLHSHVQADGSRRPRHGWSEGSLERIGIIGITLMASLAGFAAVSSLWQTFGTRARRVLDTDVARKQAGLDTATELLQSKVARLRALERKQAESPQSPSFFARVAQTLRPEAAAHEAAAVRVEVAGLEEMQRTLASALHTMRSRQAAQAAATTPLGRVVLVASHSFALYCLYRIVATSLTTLRRYWTPTSSSAFASSTDPITRILAVFAKHVDPSLDRAAWARQIAFALAGLMLLASVNAVLQTMLLFSRLAPAPARRALTGAGAAHNAALLVAQIGGTYVVSTALLLRSNLPREMGGVIEGALGAPLDTAFMERWFEGWFLGAAAVTAVGIWVGRAVVGTGDWEDELGEGGDVELGKMN